MGLSLLALAIALKSPPERPDHAELNPAAPFIVESWGREWMVKVGGISVVVDKQLATSDKNLVPKVVDGILVVPTFGGMEGIDTRGNTRWRKTASEDDGGWWDPSSVVFGRHHVAFVTGDLRHPARDQRWQRTYIAKSVRIHVVDVKTKNSGWEGSIATLGRPLTSLGASIICCKQNRKGVPVVVIRGERDGKAKLVLYPMKGDWEGFDFVNQSFTYDHPTLTRVGPHWRLALMAHPLVENPPAPYITITAVSR